MADQKRIVIIGAGAVGTNAALVFDKKGFKVTLLERTDDILVGGGVATTNITHSDGFEYHKPDHRTTGEYCIDGSITKSLLFPSHIYLTKTCSVDKPIRFFVSIDSENKDGLTPENFAKNAEHMRQHFHKQFEHLSKSRGGVARAEKLLGRNPETFAHPLKPEEYAECKNIVCGYAGSGTGVNMPQYYAMLKALLKSSNVDFQSKQNVTKIEKQKNGYYNITSNGRVIKADHIVIATAHQVPEICAKIENAEFKKKNGNRSAEGTYYLNSMTYVRLPATSDKKKIADVSRLNFTLQGDGGCMFACILPPTDKEDGYGAIYYPSEKGSQFQKHIYDKENTSPPPVQWEDYIKKGLPSEHPHVSATMQQAYRYYPFLKDYAEVDKTICRTVFNAATPDSDKGLERRVRGIIDADVITADGHITAFRSPKWTNSELVALMAVDQAMQSLGKGELPKNKEHGFGPTNLDIEQITRDLNFQNVKMEIKDALNFARKNKLPERLIDKALYEFKPIPKRASIIEHEVVQRSNYLR